MADDEFWFGATSPLIQYSPSPASSPGSNAWVLTQDLQYQTTTAGAGFQFSLFGTDFDLYGSSTCQFTATINKTQKLNNEGPDSIALIRVTQLPPAEHEFEITVTSCSGGATFAFSEGSVVSLNGSSYMMRQIEDADPRFTYSGSWTFDTNSTIDDDNHTLHSTTSPGDSFTFTFNNTLTLLLEGALKSPGSYSITLDDRTWNFSSSLPVDNPALEPLFYQGGLDPLKHHTLIGRNTGTGSFGVDFVRAYGPSSPDGTTPSASPSPSTKHSGPSALRRSSVIGLAVSLSIVFLGLLILLFLALRYQKRRDPFPESKSIPISKPKRATGSKSRS